MADNFNFTEGAGKTGAADDVGGALYQKIKLASGEADSSVMVYATTDNALYVDVRKLPTTDVGILEDMLTSLQLLDNIVAGNEAQVDIVSGTVTANLGTTDASNLTDIKTAVEILDNAIAGTEMQVDVVASLPAGTAEIGSVALTSTDSDALAAIETAVEGTLTISGTVTSNLGTTDASNLTDIKTAVEILDNAIAGTEMQVDIVAEIPAGTKEIGSVALTSTDSDHLSAIETAVEGTLTISGTVTSNLGTTDASNLTDIKTAVEILDNAIAGTEMQVDIVTAPAIAAGTNNIGKVSMEDDTVTITPIVAGTTDAYASGDLLFDTTEIASAVRSAGDTLILQSIHLVDKEDQSEEVDLVFLSSTDTIGTVNSAVNMSDASALKTLGAVKIESTNYFDMTNNQIATITGVGLVMESTGTSLYCAGVTRGTPTYTSTDSVQITFGFLRN